MRLTPSERSYLEGEAIRRMAAGEPAPYAGTKVNGALALVYRHQDVEKLIEARGVRCATEPT